MSGYISDDDAAVERYNAACARNKVHETSRLVTEMRAELKALKEKLEETPVPSNTTLRCITTIDLIMGDVTQGHVVADLREVLRSLLDTLNWDQCNAVLAHIRHKFDNAKESRLKSEGRIMVAEFAKICMAKNVLLAKDASDVAGAAQSPVTCDGAGQ